MALYLFSVLHDSDDSATAEEMAGIDAFNEQLRAEATGSWQAASDHPTWPPSSMAGTGSRC
jgi:hypothetical protein